MKKWNFLVVLFMVAQVGITQEKMPNDFVYVKEVIPNITLDVRYYTTNNFVGSQIKGYHKATCILTKQAADSLAKVQQELNSFGLGLKLFDAYRPQQAVDHFGHWAADLDDKVNKNLYYPDVPKNKLFEEGYIVAKSGHSRGSTVDLTIISLKETETYEELNMGTPYDFFGPPSWPLYQEINSTSRAHRMLLHLIMEKYGFKHLDEEWWHFTLKNEPYPDTYFNFPVE